MGKRINRKEKIKSRPVDRPANFIYVVFSFLKNKKGQTFRPQAFIVYGRSIIILEKF